MNSTGTTNADIIQIDEYIHYADGVLYASKPRGNGKVKAGSVLGYPDVHGYLFFYYAGKFHKNHRFIWQHFNHPIPSKMKIDHRDGDILNNRIGNLRLATHAQNLQNMQLSKSNTSGVKGLSWSKRNCQWRGRIGANRKVHEFRSEDRQEVELWLTINRALLHGEFLNNGTHIKNETTF